MKLIIFTFALSVRDHPLCVALQIKEQLAESQGFAKDQIRLIFKGASLKSQDVSAM